MSKREKEIWLDDAQWEGMIEGKHELEWLLNEVNRDIEQCKRDSMGDYNELIRRRNSIIRDLDELDRTMLRVHHMDELEDREDINSEDINRMIEEYEEYVDPEVADLEEEFRRHEEDERRRRKAMKDLMNYGQPMSQREINRLIEEDQEQLSVEGQRRLQEIKRLNGY